MYCQAHLGERLLADCCLPVCCSRACLYHLPVLWHLWQLLAAAQVLWQHPSSEPIEPSIPGVIFSNSDMKFAHVSHYWRLSTHAAQAY